MPDKFLRIEQVVEKTGLPKSSVYREVADNNFPKPHRLTKAVVAWRESDVEKWMSQRPVIGADLGGPPTGLWSGEVAT